MTAPASKTWVATIRRMLLIEADAQYLASIRTLVPTNMVIIGVRVPQIRQKVKIFAKDHPDLSLNQAIDFLDQAFEHQVREEILFGIFWLTRFKKRFTQSIWVSIDGWIDQIENWEVCDQLAMSIAGDWVAKNLDLLDTLKVWVGSENIWRRRFVLATATTLNQKGRRFPKQTLDLCAQAMTDPEAMVQKALGWALREVSKNSPDDVFSFLMGWKGKIPRSLLRDASLKLSKEEVKHLLA